MKIHLLPASIEGDSSEKTTKGFYSHFRKTAGKAMYKTSVSSEIKAKANGRFPPLLLIPIKFTSTMLNLLVFKVESTIKTSG